jgi:proteic killer suppression protein
VSIASFRDQGTEDVFDREDTKAARKTCPVDLWKVARRKLDQINQAQVIGDLRAPPGNRLEDLRGKRKGQHAIRINAQYRVCFFWSEEAGEAREVEIVDYH